MSTQTANTIQATTGTVRATSSQVDLGPAAWARKHKPLKKYTYQARPTPFATDRSDDSFPTAACSSTSPYQPKLGNPIEDARTHTAIRVYPQLKNVESKDSPDGYQRVTRRRQFPDRVNVKSNEDIWNMPPHKRIVFQHIVAKQQARVGQAPFATDLLATPIPMSQPLSQLEAQQQAQATKRPNQRMTTSIRAEGGFLAGSDAGSERQGAILERRRQIDARRRCLSGSEGVRAMGSSVSEVLNETRAECSSQQSASSNTRSPNPRLYNPSVSRRLDFGFGPE